MHKFRQTIQPVFPRSSRLDQANPEGREDWPLWYSRSQGIRMSDSLYRQSNASRQVPAVCWKRVYRGIQAPLCCRRYPEGKLNICLSELIIV